MKIQTLRALAMGLMLVVAPQARADSICADYGLLTAGAVMTTACVPTALNKIHQACKRRSPLRHLASWDTVQPVLKAVASVALLSAGYYGKLLEA